MTTRIPLWILLAAGAALSAGCSDRTDAGGPVGAADYSTTWEEVKDYSADRSEEFQDFMSRQVADLDAGIEDLSDRGGASWTAAQPGLEAKRAALAEELRNLAAATGDAWTAAKDRTAALYEDLRDSLQSATVGTGK